MAGLAAAWNSRCPARPADSHTAIHCNASAEDAGATVVEPVDLPLVVHDALRLAEQVVSFTHMNLLGRSRGLLTKDVGATDVVASAVGPVA